MSGCPDERPARPGNRLPSTRALAERFAVAMPTVRESLRRLQTTGAIEIRHGSGVYVSEAVDRLVLPNPNVPEPRGEQLPQLPGLCDELVLRDGGQPDKFTAFWLRDGRLRAVAGLETPRDVRAARDLIERRHPVSADVLRDEHTDLRALSRQMAAPTTR